MVVTDFNVRGVLDDLSATVVVQSDGTCKIELILKGTVEKVRGVSKSSLGYRIEIWDADGKCVYRGDISTTARLSEGDDIKVYETIYDLPYLSSYKVTISRY